MAELYEIVKLEFIALYTQKDFIDKFHEHNLTVIKSLGYLVTDDFELKCECVTHGDYPLHLPIPNKPSKGLLNLLDIKSSKYMIT